MRSPRSSLAAALAFTLVAAGCSGQAGPSDRASRITVLLKDAPAPDVTQAVVTITQIALQGPGGLSVLSTEETTTDLLTLANDVETLVDGVEILPGTYEQLRFLITGAFIKANGVVYASSPDYQGLTLLDPPAEVGGTLQMPSYGQTGLKVVFPGDGLVVGPGTTTLVVDFDVSRSFGHAAGNSGKWVMHPVVFANPVEALGTLDVTLALGEGVTLPGGATLAAFSAVVTPAGGGDTVTVPLVETAGVFGARFMNLVPGDHVVNFTGPAGLVFTTDPAVPATFGVTAGGITPAAFTLLTATAGTL